MRLARSIGLPAGVIADRAVGASMIALGVSCLALPITAAPVLGVAIASASAVSLAAGAADYTHHLRVLTWLWFAFVIATAALLMSPDLREGFPLELVLAGGVWLLTLAQVFYVIGAAFKRRSAAIVGGLAAAATGALGAAVMWLDWVVIDWTAVSLFAASLTALGVVMLLQETLGRSSTISGR